MLKNFAAIVNPEDAEYQMLKAIDAARLPRHVAVIMDGNGRWAAQKFRPRIAGHRAGVESVRACVDTSARLGLEALTLYAFSTENWKRPSIEVSALMRMLRRYLRLEIDELDKHNIRFQPIGRIEGLPANVRKDLDWAVERTQNNRGMILSIALNYGGRAEIIDACRNAFRQISANGGNIEDLDEDLFEQSLYTHNLPELDLLIRTSGEMRISNFLLWQAAYAEIYVTPTLFPDFRRPHLLEAVLDFQKRNRRFGGIKQVKF